MSVENVQKCRLRNDDQYPKDERTYLCRLNINHTAWKLFFWSVFCSIQSEFTKIRTRKNSVFGHFSCIVSDPYCKAFLYRLASMLDITWFVYKPATDTFKTASFWFFKFLWLFNIANKQIEQNHLIKIIGRIWVNKIKIISVN